MTSWTTWSLPRALFAFFQFEKGPHRTADLSSEGRRRRTTTRSGKTTVTENGPCETHPGTRTTKKGLSFRLTPDDTLSRTSYGGRGGRPRRRAVDPAGPALRPRMASQTTVKSRSAVKMAAARAMRRAETAPRVGPTKDLVKDVGDLSLAVEILCEVISELEFRAGEKP